MKVDDTTTKAKPMREALSRLGARLGTWNDMRGYGRGRRNRLAAGLRWRTLDRVAGWLYTLPDRS